MSSASLRELSRPPRASGHTIQYDGSSNQEHPILTCAAQTGHESCDCPHHGWNFESCGLVSGGPQTVLTIRDPRPESYVLQLFSKFTKYVNDKISCAKVLIKSICVQVLRLYKACLKG